MLGLKIFFGILLFLIYIIMMSIMIIFERDKPKNIIIWSIIFLVSSVIGYIIYGAFRIVFFKKKESLVKKDKEDDIYINLVNSEIYDNNKITQNELYEFNRLAYGAKLTSNNTYKFYETYTSFKTNLIDEIKNAKSYIILELTKVNKTDFEPIVDLLIEKVNAGIIVKFVYENMLSFGIVNRLRKAGVKVYRFSKYNTIGKVYANKRNSIVIDGSVAYIGSLEMKNRQLSGNVDMACSYLKLTGDVVQDIDLSAHKDVVFASGKFMPYIAPRREINNSSCNMQFVTNEFNNDIELLIIKAICMAKKSIQLQLKSFVPTESIMSLLRFAINSNIEVRLMVPLKTNFRTKYYAYRAYAKELALFGANVYLYDGYITYNSIVIDDMIVLYGSYILDREHLSTALQNVMVIENKDVANFFNNKFEDCVNNSYRICNAKYMLTREKFFKNFV